MTKTATAGRLRICTSADDLPPIWDELAQTGDLSFDRRYLRVVERCSVSTGDRCYLVYETPAGAAAIATARVLRKPCLHNPVTDVLLGRLSNRLAAGRNWLLPMLLLRADLNGDSPVAIRAAFDSERTAVLDGFLQAIEKHATREHCVLAAAGVPADDAKLIGALRRFGYLQTEGRPVADVVLRWNSWDAFLEEARSRSKNAASSIRHETKRARREGVSFVEWDPRQIPEATLHGLLDDHERRRNGRGFRFKAGLLSALNEALGDRVRIMLALCKKQVQAITVLICNGGRGYLLFPGLVEKADRSGFAYFNLAYYQPIQLGLELGLKSLAYGNGAFPAKIRRGATATGTGLFLRPRHALARAALSGPMALHRRVLRQKYAPILRAPAFSTLK